MVQQQGIGEDAWRVHQGEIDLKLPELKVLAQYDEHSRIVLENIRAHHIPGRNLRILEAGCGRDWPYRAGDLSIHLTGVDIDQAALEARRRSGDLDVSVNGDLREVEFPSANFDVIYSKFVLEHLKGAELVLDRFLNWLRPGGLLILIFPDRESVYSLFTRLTPFSFHVLFKKHVLGETEAGQVGHGPYPTYSEEITGRTVFRRYCVNKNIDIVAEYGLNDDRMPLALRWFMRGIELLSLGKVRGGHSNLVYILKIAGNR